MQSAALTGAPIAEAARQHERRQLVRQVVAQLRLSEASETTSDGLPSERRLGNDDAARVLAEQRHAQQRGLAARRGRMGRVEGCRIREEQERQPR